MTVSSPTISLTTLAPSEVTSICQRYAAVRVYVAIRQSDNETFKSLSMCVEDVAAAATTLSTSKMYVANSSGQNTLHDNRMCIMYTQNISD